MSCPNFKTQKDFPLFVTSIFDGYYREDEDGKEVWIDWDSPMYHDLEADLENFNEDLQFFKLTAEGGYYSGVQLMLEPDDPDRTLTKDFTPEEWRKYRKEARDYPGSYYTWDFEYSYSEQKKLEQKEIRKIKEFCKTVLAKEYGFEEYACRGVFSNGEAVYEKVSG